MWNFNRRGCGQTHHSTIQDIEQPNNRTATHEYRIGFRVELHKDVMWNDWRYMYLCTARQDSGTYFAECRKCRPNCPFRSRNDIDNCASGLEYSKWPAKVKLVQQRAKVFTEYFLVGYVTKLNHVVSKYIQPTFGSGPCPSSHLYVPVSRKVSAGLTSR